MGIKTYTGVIGHQEGLDQCVLVGAVNGREDLVGQEGRLGGHALPAA